MPNQCKTPEKIKFKTKISFRINKLKNKFDLFLDYFRSNKPFKYEVGSKVFINNPDNPYGQVQSRRKVRPHMNRYKVEILGINVDVPADLPEESILQTLINF